MRTAGPSPIGRENTYEERLPIRLKTLVAVIVSAYGSQNSESTFGAIKSTSTSAKSPRSACLIWFTAGLIFSSFPHEVIIRNPHHIL